MFYTFVDRCGDKIFHRFVDENGKRRIEVVEEFPLEIFTPGQRQDSKSLDGLSLSRIDFSDVKTFRKFVDNGKDMMKLFGQASAAHQFISSVYPEEIKFDLSKVRILNFDIETEADQGFPDPKQAAQKILSISLKLFGRDDFITLGLKDVSKKKRSRYIKCNNEAQLLNTFLGLWMTIKPDFVTGWNIEGFDIPYIVNRITRVLGEDKAKELSPFHKDARHVIQEIEIKNGRGDTTYRIQGVTVLDYYQLYLKFAPQKLEQYKLDFVGEHEGVGKKVDYSEYGDSLTRLYNENFDLFIDYNEEDVLLVERLDQKLDFVRLAVSIAMMTKSRIHEVFGTVKIWDNLVYNMLRKEGVQPPPEDYTKESKDFVGGFVKEPDPGKYKWVVSLDLTSLYPSIIRMYNMSPETLVGRARGREDWMTRMLNLEDVTGAAKAENCAMAANGTVYRQDVQGILPRAMAYVFNERKRFKNLMLASKKKREKLVTQNKDTSVCDQEISMYNACQLALKVVANGGYGSIGNKAFRYFDPDIAEAITLTGQMTIQYIERRINEFLNARLKTNDFDYVITMDTDSVYITLDKYVAMTGLNDTQKIVDALDHFIKTEIELMLQKEYGILADYVGAKTNLMDMKREAIGDVGIFRGKKNYIMQVYDNEDVRFAEPLLKMVGIETAKSSTPRIVRDALTDCLKIIVNGSQEKLFENIKKFKDEFMNADLYQVASPRGVSNYKKYMTDNSSQPFMKGAPIHVKGVISYNMAIASDPKLHNKYEMIKEGSKIKFMYLRQPNHFRTNVISFVDKLPKEFGLEPFIDRDLQFEKVFLNPLQSFTDLVGWKVEKKASLEDLF